MRKLVAAMWPDSAVYSPKESVFELLSHQAPGAVTGWQLVSATANCMGRASPERQRLLTYVRIEARRRASEISVTAMVSERMHWHQSRAEYYRERDWALEQCGRLADYLNAERDLAMAENKACV